MTNERVSGARRIFTLIVIIVIALVLIGAIGYAAFIFISGSGEASQDISTVVDPLENPGENVYVIAPEQSAARFYIDEVLNGQDKTVVGETNQVGGEIDVNFEDPAETQIGQIVINARTLQTDDDNRNRALRTFILQSNQDEYEFITFNPRMLEIESQSNDDIVPGTTLQVSITGDLTVIEATREVMFTGEVTYNADDTVSGLLEANIRYADFDISIQAPPIVSDISEELRLEIDFTAVPSGTLGDSGLSDDTEDSAAEEAEDEEAPAPETTEEAE
jgi:polyisoprenoid-binding protein YceI